MQGEEEKHNADAVFATDRIGFYKNIVLGFYKSSVLRGIRWLFPM